VRLDRAVDSAVAGEPVGAVLDGGLFGHPSGSPLICGFVPRGRRPARQQVERLPGCRPRLGRAEEHLLARVTGEVDGLEIERELSDDGMMKRFTPVRWSLT
jgi:hypothetical protein